MIKTILYPPTIDWDFMFQRPQQIMRQFAKHGWRVIYCNKRQVRGAKLEEVEPNLFICRDLPGFVMNDHTDVIYSSWAKCADIVSAIPHKLVIYDRIDDFVEWEPYEESMIKVADIVLTSSQVLYDKTVNMHNNVHLVRNACDFDHFNENKKIEVAYRDALPKPVIGFIGALGQWVDMEIMEEIAENYTLLIVGVEFGRKAPKKSIFLGQKPYKELPVFYNSIDIGIIPFRVDSRISHAANPIKMYEYLASGKPVIATPTVETSLFPGHVHLLRPGGLAQCVQDALNSNAEGDKLSRMLIAKKNTWESRYKIIAGEIERRI